MSLLLSNDTDGYLTTLPSWSRAMAKSRTSSVDVCACSPYDIPIFCIGQMDERYGITGECKGVRPTGVSRGLMQDTLHVFIFFVVTTRTNIIVERIP